MTKYFLWISIQKIFKTENESLPFNIKHNGKTKKLRRNSKLVNLSIFMLKLPLDETLHYKSKIYSGILSQKSSNIFRRIIITPP